MSCGDEQEQVSHLKVLADEGAQPHVPAGDPNPEERQM